MKKLILILLFIIPLMSFGQSMNIRWSDSGIEFSINTHTGELDYSVSSGEIRYNSIIDSGPEGYIKSIGSVSIKYNSILDSGPEGYVKSTSGSVK